MQQRTAQRRGQRRKHKEDNTVCVMYLNHNVFEKRFDVMLLKIAVQLCFYVTTSHSLSLSLLFSLFSSSSLLFSSVKVNCFKL